MQGVTLVVSKEINLFPFIIRLLKAVGYTNISTTSVCKDGLNTIINQLEPTLMIIETGYYECGAPHMIGILLESFPKLNVAFFSLGFFPPDIAMCCLVNGVKSFLYFCDGEEQFNVGLRIIKNGKSFVSQSVQRKYDKRDILPKKTKELSPRLTEILKYICNGFTTVEIAQKLNIAIKTVEYYKKDLFGIFSVRNEKELVRIALYSGYIKINELDFFNGKYKVKNKYLPENNFMERQKDVLRFICNGYTEDEIIDVILISKRMISTITRKLKSHFNTRNEIELIRVALHLGFIKVDELCFYSRNYEV
jgi:DNA-binding NarL/FixJ family response regulator